MATSIEFLEQMLLNDNIKAAMHVVRFTEGCLADDAWQYLFGSSPKNDLRFTDMSKHPNIHRPFGNSTSTAAGAYQILYGTWVELCTTYKFTDFTPHTQDLMFCALLDQANVLTAVSKGFILQEAVMSKMGAIWASLPMSGYGQPTHSVADVRAAYLGAGGSIGGLA